MVALLFFLAVLPCLHVGHCANILGIWYHGGKSHHILGEVLLKELARKGHNVTMVSAFPLKEPFPNYTDIHLTGILEDQKSREDQFMKMNRGKHAFVGSTDVLELTRAQTELTLKHPEMKKLLASGTKFDVILMDWFVNTATLVFASLLDAPVIPISSHGTSFLATIPTGCPSPPSYVPQLMLDFPSNMTFLQRVVNGLASLVFNIGTGPNRRYHMELVRKYYGEGYTFEGLMERVALIFSNAHYSFETPRPFVPNLVPIGGYHVQKPGKLPKDLQTYMDKSKNGVIYFSLGSNMKSIYLPKEKQEAILKVFGKLPYDVLWKWEESEMAGKPANVKLGKWFPQNEILAHPNTKLFVSHGGLLSTIEALHYAMPVLGIPIFGDQRSNILKAVQAGYALRLELADLTEETLLNSLNEILTNPRYKDAVQKRSALLKDQPLPPMDHAVFWVEHVIRHKGAPHLRNAGVDLPFYQYIMLDVAAFVIAILILIFFIIYYISKCIFSCLCGKKQKGCEPNKKKD